MEEQKMKKTKKFKIRIKGTFDKNVGDPPNGNQKDLEQEVDAWYEAEGLPNLINWFSKAGAVKGNSYYDNFTFDTEIDGVEKDFD